jgi:hypothetical protein
MKIYPQLRLLWISFVIGTALNFAAFSSSEAVLFIGSLASLAAYGVSVFVLRRLSGESRRFGRAFTYQLFSVALLTLSIVFSFIAGENDMLLIFSTLLMLTGSTFGLFSKYEMYWAMDERVIPQGYAYPARRIRWCFYAPLLGALCVTMLQFSGLDAIGLAIQLICQIIPLVLLYQYVQAVKAREDDPLCS